MDGAHPRKAQDWDSLLIHSEKRSFRFAMKKILCNLVYATVMYFLFSYTFHTTTENLFIRAGSIQSEVEIFDQWAFQK